MGKCAPFTGSIAAQRSDTLFVLSQECNDLGKSLPFQCGKMFFDSLGRIVEMLSLPDTEYTHRTRQWARTSVIRVQELTFFDEFINGIQMELSLIGLKGKEITRIDSDSVANSLGWNCARIQQRK